MTRLELIPQERQQSRKVRSGIAHTNSGQFIVNMAALHNHRWIRKALPQTLLSPTVFFPDRAAVRTTAAASLRNVQLQRKLTREAAKRKQAEDARLATAPNAEVDLVPLEQGLESEDGDSEQEVQAPDEGPDSNRESSAEEDANRSGLDVNNQQHAHIDNAFTEGHGIVTGTPRGPRGKHRATNSVGRYGRNRSGRGRGSGGMTVDSEQTLVLELSSRKRQKR